MDNLVEAMRHFVLVIQSKCKLLPYINLTLETFMPKTFKPGTPAPKSGQYENIKTGHEITGVRGKPLPPTPRPAQGYILVDQTKHKRK